MRLFLKKMSFVLLASCVVCSWVQASDDEITFKGVTDDCKHVTLPPDNLGIKFVESNGVDTPAPQPASYESNQSGQDSPRK